MRRAAAIVLSLGVALGAAGGAPALAEGGARPHLEKIEPASGVAGGVVEVRGTNFSDTVDDIAASVGGEVAIVLEAAPDRLRLLLPPALAPGVYPLEVRVGAEKSNELKLTIRKPGEAELKRREEAPRHEGPAGRDLSDVKILTLDAPEPVSDRGSFAIQVAGRGELPDGCVIRLALRLGDDTVATTDATLNAQRFSTSFGPYPRELFAGTYWVDATFNFHDQGKAIRETIKSFFRDPIERAAREKAKDRQICRVGTPEQEKTQEQDIRRHIATAIARTRGLARELEYAYAGAGRSAFVTNGKVDEAAWEAWLAVRTLKTVPRAERAAQADLIRTKTRFLTDGGLFADARWREWLDHKFRIAVFTLAKDHRAYCERFVAIKYPDAMRRLEELFGLVATHSQTRSRELYEKNGLPVPGEDASTESLDVLRLGSTRATLASVEATARQIGRDVGLTPAEEAEGDAEARRLAEEESR